jgi:hypothetical protein
VTGVNIAKVKRLADRIIGTCVVGSTLVDQVDNLSREEGKVLDVFAFKCVGCEWWFAAHERETVNDEWMCYGCAEDARHA